MASLATFVLHGGRIGQSELTFYAVVIGASLVVAYGAWAVRQLRLWYWRRTRGPVDLREVTSVTVDVAAPSIETDLLIERVKPLCYGVWMAAQKGDVTPIRSQVSDQLAQRLAEHPRSMIGESPIAGLQVVSTTGDGDAIQQFQATVTTQAGGHQRWTFRRQGSGWLVDDIAA